MTNTMTEIETETKLVLSEEGYGRLLRGGRLIGCRDQLNVYFHDPARLGENLGYLRVRYETDRTPVATLKLPVDWVGDTRRMKEVERPLSELGPGLYPRPRRWIDVEEDLSPAFAEPLAAQGIQRVRRLGWMRNRRCLLALGPERTVELDRTSLPDGGVLYEVEIEDPSQEVHRALTARVRELVPEARVSRVGKFSRFLAATDRTGLPPGKGKPG